jgi:uncharacterized membrane protein YbhN (UPF0104 family)
MKNKKLLRAVLALTASVVAGYFVVSRLPFGDLARVARDFDLRLLLLSFTAYLGANAFRAFRFRLLVDGKVSALAFFRIVCAQNFVNTFMPFRSGEFLYLYLVHRTGSVTSGRGIGSLLGARALDAVVALAIPLAVSPFSRVWSAPGHLLLGLTIFLLALILVLAGAVLQANRVANYLEARFAGKAGRLGRLIATISDTLRALGELRERGVLAGAALLSLGSWSAIYLSGYLLLFGTENAPPLADALFAYGFPTLASMTPFYMLGGFGVYEGSVGIGLSLVGMQLEKALAVGLLLHAAELGFVVVAGLIAPLAIPSTKQPT